MNYPECTLQGKVESFPYFNVNLCYFFLVRNRQLDLSYVEGMTDRPVDNEGVPLSIEK